MNEHTYYCERAIGEEGLLYRCGKIARWTWFEPPSWYCSEHYDELMDDFRNMKLNGRWQ